MSGGWVKWLIAAAVFLVLVVFLVFAAALIAFLPSWIGRGASGGQTPTPQPTQSGNQSTPTPEPTRNNSNHQTTTPTPTPAVRNIADRIRSEMDMGNIVYDPPTAMNLDETKVVNVLLGPKKSVAELERLVPDKKGRTIQSDRVQWYGYMQADMASQEFEITPITPASQLVGGQDVTKWSWSIKPKKPGKQYLYLTLYAIVDDNGSEKPLVIQPFSPKVIEVKVTPYQRAAIILNTVGGHMEWVLTALIGIIFPLTVWLWSRARSRAKDESSPMTEKNKKTPKKKAGKK